MIRRSMCSARQCKLFLLVAFSFSLAVCNQNATTIKSKIIIIGAGMSGVGFAERLMMEKENDFLLLEARDVVGGRMRDQKFANITVNLGAGWIHDVSSTNPFWKYRNAFGLKTVPDNYSNFIVRNEQGGIVQEAGKIFNDVFSLTGKLSTFLARESKAKKMDIPLRTSLSIIGWRPKNAVEDTLDYYLIDFENANSAEVLSSRHVTITGKVVDQIVTDARGYSHIPKRLSKPFNSKIHFNTIVNSITYDKNSVVIKAMRNGSNITYMASYAVVTVSTGVLAGSSIKFSPPLPDWKIDAIYKIPMGHYTKIFLKFPSKFWDNAYYILTATKFRGQYCHWQNLARDGLYKNSNILLLTVTGKESIRVEKLTDQEIMADAMVALRKMYGSSIPNATDIKLHRWSLDPYTRGAYASPVVGSEEINFKALSAPIGRTLWFSGEATDLETYGYTHGAYINGHAAGTRFMQCINKDKCPAPFPASKSAAKRSADLSYILQVFYGIALLLCLQV